MAAPRGALWAPVPAIYMDKIIVGKEVGAALVPECLDAPAAWTLALAQIPFIINFFWSAFRGEKASDNPWEATTLEWATPTPPPHGNFTSPPVVYRGPYEYSVPGRTTDWLPQHQP